MHKLVYDIKLRLEGGETLSYMGEEGLANDGGRLAPGAFDEVMDKIREKVFVDMQKHGVAAAVPVEVDLGPAPEPEPAPAPAGKVNTTKTVKATA